MDICNTTHVSKIPVIEERKTNVAYRVITAIVVQYELYELYDWGKSSGTLWNFIMGLMERNNYDYSKSSPMDDTPLP